MSDESMTFTMYARTVNDVTDVYDEVRSLQAEDGPLNGVRDLVYTDEKGQELQYPQNSRMDMAAGNGEPVIEVDYDEWEAEVTLTSPEDYSTAAQEILEKDDISRIWSVIADHYPLTESMNEAAENADKDVDEGVDDYPSEKPFTPPLPTDDQ